MNLLLAASTGEGAGVILTLFVMLVAAKLFAELFERIRQPAVAGEILAGIIIGPSLLGLIAPSEITNVLAEIGVIFLLFNVGLETKPTALLRVGKTALLVAVLGVLAPFAGGWLLMRAWGGNDVQALFLGTAMVATSVGITARVLSAMGMLNTETARIILGAAVIDDILGLIILAIVSGTAGGSLDLVEIGTTAALAIGFTLFVAFVGAPVVTRAAPRVEALRVGHSLFVFGLILCLGLSAAAMYIGVAAIIGAFLAGMALAEAAEGNEMMHRQTNGVTEFLVPFFLVNIGMQLELRSVPRPVGHRALNRRHDCGRRHEILRLWRGRVELRAAARGAGRDGDGAARRGRRRRRADRTRPRRHRPGTLRRRPLHGRRHDAHRAALHQAALRQ